MNPESETPAKSRAGLNPEVLFLTAIFGAVAISAQSFWMDEAVTAIIAGQNSFSGWLKLMTNYAGSDQQMPLYMFGIWVWQKMCGSGEWVLRAANLACLALALTALPRRPAMLLLVVLVNPFLWYYLDEARPYALQICSALMLLGATHRLAQKPDAFAAAWFCLGCVLLAGSSLIGMIWCGAFLAAACLVLGWDTSRRLLRENFVVFGIAGFLLTALAAYYLWTLSHPSSVAQTEAGAANFFFAGYELLGLAGLGPGREQIRAGGLAAFKPYWALLSLQAAVTFFVLAAGARRILKSVPRRVSLGLILIFGSTVIFLLTMGMIKHFRVLGRHNAPLLAPLALWLAFGLDELWQYPRRRWLAGLFILLSLASALSLRFAGRHEKFDFRDAAAIASETLAQGGRVWWCADVNGALYYGLPLRAAQRAAPDSRIWVVPPLSRSTFTNRPPPDVVVLARPDQNDPGGQLRDWLAEHHYRLAETPHLFTVWRTQ